MSNTSKRLASKLGLVLSVTLVLSTIGVLPASASAGATATVNIHNVLAGQSGKVFTLNVRSTEQAILGKNITEVRIIPPVNRILATAGAANGWEAKLLGTPPNTQVRFRPAAGGSGIAPGGNLNFSVTGTVTDQRAQDSSDNWVVAVSSDNLTSNTATAPATQPNGLVTTVRQLQVENVAVVGPSLAADDYDGNGTQEVTGTQSGICVRTQVKNASASNLVVTPALAMSGGATSGSVGPARPMATTPCSAAPLANGSATVTGKTSAFFDFLTSYTDPGSLATRNLKGTASATGATTPDTSAPDDIFVASRNLDVEPKAVLSYVPDTIQPRAVVPGSAGKVFTMEIDKTPGDSPKLSAVSGDLKSDFCDAIPATTTVVDFPALTTPRSLDQGGVTAAAAFQSCNILALGNGKRPVTPRFAYTDANGLVQPLTDMTGVEQIRLDSLIPSINNLTITPPASQVQTDQPGVPAAALSNGQAFDISATVTDKDTVGTQEQDLACGAEGGTAPLVCTLVSVKLLQTGATDGSGAIDITDKCSLNGSGNLTCNDVAVTFGTNVSSARATAIVKDEAGSQGPGTSPAVDVDNVIPAIAAEKGALVTRGPVAGQRRQVTVSFTEAVQNDSNTNSALDWSVQDGQVRPVAAVMEPGNKRSRNLTTVTDFDPDPDTGTITYAPTVTSSPYHDRVGLDIANPVTKPLTDGIAPLAPVFTRVDGDGPDTDGKFYFNDTTPDITLTSTDANDPAMRTGYDVEIYEEANGIAGLQRLGDRRICREQSIPGTARTHVPERTLACNVGVDEVETKTYALSIDFNGNEGAVAEALLVLDITPPRLLSGVVAGNQLTATFTEDLVAGTDVATHWVYYARSIADQEINAFFISGITKTIDKVRVLTIDEYTAADFTPLSLQWIFDGVNTQLRYEDRAGNAMLDIDPPQAI
jgi:hypothetical protein